MLTAAIKTTTMACLDMNISLPMFHVPFYTASIIFSASKVTKCGLLKTINVAIFWDMAPCSRMRTDVSDELITSIFRVENQPSTKSLFITWTRRFLF
jgi:hypothetical protein